MISGDILEISVNNPTIGLIKFFPKAGEAGTLDPGGFTSADEAQGLDGGGRLINQKNAKRWMLEVVCSSDNVTTDDVQRAQDIQNSLEESTFTFSHISGVVWSGTGVIVGDLNLDTNAGTFTLKASGGGRLQKQ